MFDKLSDSHVKNGMFILRTGQRMGVLLSCLKLSVKLLQLNLHFRPKFGQGGGMEGGIFQIFWQHGLAKVSFFL